MYLISSIVPYFIVGLMAAAGVFGIFMLIEGRGAGLVACAALSPRVYAGSRSDAVRVEIATPFSLRSVSPAYCPRGHGVPSRGSSGTHCVTASLSEHAHARGILRTLVLC